MQVSATGVMVCLLPSAGMAQVDIISDVSPLVAEQRTEFTLTIMLDETTDSPPVPQSRVSSASVKIGALEGSGINRFGYEITAVFSVSSESDGMGE